MLLLHDLKARVECDTYYEKVFGHQPSLIAHKKHLLSTLVHALQAQFNVQDDEAVWVYFVPGRIEILGKHTDYAGGHSLLIATDRGFHAITRVNNHGRIRLYETDPQYGQRDFPFSGNVNLPASDWSKYPITVANRLHANFHHHCPLKGIDVVFNCDLPVAGGLSGSSALMIMTFLAIAGSNRLLDHSFFQRNVANNIDLAMYLACVENGQTFKDFVGSHGVGTFGGSEDHTEILNGKRGMLSLFKFCPTIHERDIPYPEDLTTIIAHSGVMAEKTGAAKNQYNLAARRAQLLVRQYNQVYDTQHTLIRDILRENIGMNAKHLIHKIETATDKAPYHRNLDLTGRFTQFYYEDQKHIPEAVHALNNQDFKRLGESIDHSHRASAQFLWNIVPEIDFLQQTARQLGAIAASGFGAGFGGSAYALVPKTNKAFIKEWAHQYQQKFPEHTSTSHFFAAFPCEKATELFATHSS